MGSKMKGPLTEPMFYILLAFYGKERCGTDIAEYVNTYTAGRVKLGPGTLYTILSNFLADGWIEEIEVCGRKRTYRMTEAGREAYCEELERLRRCVADGEAVLNAIECKN